ncbi:T9SS type B sorting domain-containing protein [Flagellimonas algicola]|uniref:T9SS type B sorting domain-containing protein n=1 Tax=Flagellimonas algicola TaxID=2583815 RepID=A0ABY2WRR6_9FLAO|nr:T9SS type B sorting domain-containing protein [Allomuricauda algicola]TMU57204.1 T9SS type B sorting domain-containing protein [Allomuricauda algicola]
MLKKLLHIVVLGITAVGMAQECPNLLSPVNGATNVPVDATITWAVSDGIPGYRIRLGTTDGGAEILEQSVGSATTYTPPLGLPENTQIYVTIILDFLFQGSQDIICSSQTFTTEDVVTAPGCTTFRTPVDGATDVSVFSNLSWFYAPTATGYNVSIGTAPGTDDVVPLTDVGNVISFNPPGQLPANTQLYATVTPYNENGNAPNCSEISFTTATLAPLPGCTSLVTPANGEINVPLTPLIEWLPVPGATGYRVTIGSTIDGTDILNNTSFSSNSTLVLNFEPNRTFFITIVPFNAAGSAIGCVQESFSTLLGCGPYLDPNTGEFITFGPEIDFPETLSFCQNEAPLTITAPDFADGYRWFQIDDFDNEVMISNSNEVTVSENGRYRYMAFNVVSQGSGIVECPTSQVFEVVSSETATINGLSAVDTALGFEVTISATGNGDYEFAVDDINGPYQDSNVFSGVIPGSHTFYVRDKNGCGTVSEKFIQDLSVEGFPKFFTPNGDNVNDIWQFVLPKEGNAVIPRNIRIFDRYGRLLSVITENSSGWDGNYGGRPLPAGEYWFSATDDQNREVQGHFALKR